MTLDEFLAQEIRYKTEALSGNPLVAGTDAFHEGMIAAYKNVQEFLDGT